jgi:pyrroloquinoline quinone biosynthesis protein B
VNASPDLRLQIEAFAQLQPRLKPSRNSRIEGVLLTNADLDHVLGLLLLREGDLLHVHASTFVRESLACVLRLDALLDCFCGIQWHEPREKFSPLVTRDGFASGLAYCAIPLSGSPPRFAKKAVGKDQSVAFQIRDEKTRGRVLIAPAVASLDDRLAHALDESDAVLFDGTFWSNEELQKVDLTARTAYEMGHLPISNGSLDVLSKVSAQRKIYTHINNTNPILAPHSSERVQVENAGVVIGYDGLEFEL